MRIPDREQRGLQTAARSPNAGGERSRAHLGCGGARGRGTCGPCWSALSAPRAFTTETHTSLPPSYTALQSDEISEGCSDAVGSWLASPGTTSQMDDQRTPWQLTHYLWTLLSSRMPTVGETWGAQLHTLREVFWVVSAISLCVASLGFLSPAVLAHLSPSFSSSPVVSADGDDVATWKLVGPWANKSLQMPRLRFVVPCDAVSRIPRLSLPMKLGWPSTSGQWKRLTQH